MSKKDVNLSKANCLELLAEIENGIENTEKVMGEGGLNDAFRRGKLQAYYYCRSRLLMMMRWKGME